MTTPNPSRSTTLLSLPLILLSLSLLLFAYRAYNMAVPTFYGIADEHGYMMTAKRLVTLHSIAQHQADPYAFIGETMMQSPSPRSDPTTYYLRQPIGYPLLLAFAYLLGGPGASFFVNPLLALALLGAIYIIGKELGVPMMAAIAALFLALHPLLLYYTLTPLSHIPDMAVAAWTIAAGLLWRREKQFWQAVALGVLTGVAIYIRYTNILLLLPLAIILIEQLRSSPSPPSSKARADVPPQRRQIYIHALVAILTTTLFLLPLLYYHTLAFGGPLRTGYSVGGNATSFSIAWFFAHAPAMASILFHPGTGLSLLLLPLIAGVIILSKKNRFVLALLLAWALPPLLLYTAYYGMPENNTLLYARFTLSALPPLVFLAMLWPVYVAKHRSLCTTAAIVLAAVAIILSLLSPFMQKALDDLNNNMLANYAVASMVKKEVSPGSVVVADLFTHYFLDYAGDYTIYAPDMFTRPLLDKRLADLQRTPHENDPARTQQLATLLGNKSPEELMAILRQQLSAYDANGTPVYMVTAQVRQSSWSQFLQATLRPISATSGDGEIVLYRLNFPPITTTHP